VQAQIQRESELDSWDYKVWRPVIAGKAQKFEIDMYWSIDDLLDCIEILDIQDALEDEARNKQ
jgi:hypothetical protein